MKTSVKILAVLLSTAAPTAANAVVVVTGDPVLFWTDLAVRNLAGVGAAPAQARAIAMVNTAMHDAVSRASGGTSAYYNQGVAAPGGDVRAAATMAAYNVLVTLNPANAGIYQAARDSSLALIADGVAKTNGMATGTAYAAAMIANRQGDGSTATVTYTPGTLPGEWRPTPPGFAPAAVPHWGGVTPFLMNSGSQFRPGAPPALGSAEYLAAYNEVKEIGALNSVTRTVDQTNSALFWDISNGLTWSRIGVDLLEDDGLSAAQNAVILAKLTTAVADSLISGFDAKYVYNLWRPVTAIREGDNDGVAGTIGDPNWSPLFATPAHPSYPSTHSLQSGAAAAVLLGLVQDQAFCNTIGADTRCFTGIAQAAQDAADSRLWGGIHFRFDNETGIATGYTIGQWALSRNAFNAVPEPSTWLMMIAGFGLIGGVMRGKRTVRVRYA